MSGNERRSRPSTRQRGRSRSRWRTFQSWHDEEFWRDLYRNVVTALLVALVLFTVGALVGYFGHRTALLARIVSLTLTSVVALGAGIYFGVRWTSWRMGDGHGQRPSPRLVRLAAVAVVLMIAAFVLAAIIS